MKRVGLIIEAEKPKPEAKPPKAEKPKSEQEKKGE